MAGQDIWVFSEKQDLQDELIAGAHTLAKHTGGEVVALVAGDRARAESTRGAARVLWLGEQAPDRLVEDYVPTLAAEIEKQPPFALLVGATRRGRAVAGRLAAKLDTAVLTDVQAFSFTGEDLQAQHMIFGGGAVQIDRAISRPVIATVGPGVFDRQPAELEERAVIQEVSFVPPAVRAVLQERKPRPPAAVDLRKAKKVVCAGRGIARREDLEMVEELASLLGAEVACSRPLAEGLDWLPIERYIGISGAIIRPDLYMGVGVSGQAQHVIGMSAARVVVAVNTDQNAPIYEHADYAIPDDLYAVLPAMIQILKERK